MIRNFRELKASLSKIIGGANRTKAARGRIGTLPTAQRKASGNQRTKRWGRFIPSALWTKHGGIRRHCTTCKARYQ